MNWIFAILDAIVEWIRRNPLTCILLVMLAVFVPSAFGAILIAIAVVALLLLAIPLIGILKLRRMSKKMGEQARHQGFGGQGFGGQGFGGQGFTQERYTRNSSEGEVRVYPTNEATEKRVNDKVGEYVDFEEVKNK